jgi:hypothetical protein
MNAQCTLTLTVPAPLPDTQNNNNINMQSFLGVGPFFLTMVQALANLVAAVILTTMSDYGRYIHTEARHHQAGNQENGISVQILHRTVPKYDKSYR